MTGGDDGAFRAPRHDARANRERLLDATSRVFAAQGPEATVEVVARAAGLGIGTLYRHFPTKDALVSEVVNELLREVCVEARAALQEEDGSGLETFLVRAASRQADRGGCLERLFATRASSVDLLEIRTLVAELLREAKICGKVRSDVTPSDITVIFWSLRGVIETTEKLMPGAWRRHLSLLIAGLRPSPVPLAGTALTQSEMRRIAS